MKITIEGELTKEEAFELLLKVRAIDKRHPEQRVSVVVDDQTMPHEEMQKLLKAVFEGEAYELATFTKEAGRDSED